MATRASNRGVKARGSRGKGGGGKGSRPSSMPAQLRQSYLYGKVAPRIGWGSAGSGRRCMAQAAKHGVPARMRPGMCQNLHQALGLHMGAKGRKRG